MPIVLVFIGIILIVSGFQNTYQQVGKMVAGDFTGSPNFFTWLAAIAIIGGLGYYEPLEKPSRLFLGLLVAVLILTKGTGFASQFNQAITSAANAHDNIIGAPLPGSGASGGIASDISQTATIVAAVSSFF